MSSLGPSFMSLEDKTVINSIQLFRINNSVQKYFLLVPLSPILISQGWISALKKDLSWNEYK